MGCDLPPSSLRLSAGLIFLGRQDRDSCVPSGGCSHWAFCFFKASGRLSRVLTVTTVVLTCHRFCRILRIIRTAREPPTLRGATTQKPEHQEVTLGAAQHRPTSVKRPLRGLSGGWEVAGGGCPFTSIGRFQTAENHLQLQIVQCLWVPYVTSASDICWVTQGLRQSW